MAHKKGIYFPELDGLRFFAFLLVFFSHHSIFRDIPLLKYVFFKSGWIGVDLFFVLSAYLFTKLLLVEYARTNSISIKKFYIRRIFRIWPVYFLFISFSIVLYFFVLGDHKFTNYIFIRLVGLFTFSDNIMTAYYGVYNSFPYITPLWTIGFEEQFYAIIPFLILFLAKSSPRVRVIVLVSTVIIFNIIRFLFIVNKAPQLAVWMLPCTHFESIILGIIIGFGGFEAIPQKMKNILALIGFLLFLVMCWLQQVLLPDNQYWLILILSLAGVSTSFFMYSVINNKRLKTFFSINLFVFLGKRSYGLYVYHIFGIACGNILISYLSFIPHNLLLSFVVAIFFTVLFAVTSYHFIEKPFLVLKKRFEVISTRPI